MGVHAKVKSLRKPAGGRPRALTQDQVVDTALKLGLEEFTMKRVAEELGVSIPTIYQCVGDRGDLLRLAIARLLSSLPYPPDVGQHWSTFLREYAQATHDLLTVDPHVLVRFLHCGFVLESELQVLENFLQFMVPRGFTPREAVQILRQVLIAATGVAVATCRERATIQRSGSVEQALHEALAHYPPGHLALFSQAGVNYLSTNEQLASVIEPIIRFIAYERGENLPT
ncbi:MAG TPA: TetR/AcrR family transcriptional regulator C-terminal domain-containing protein [Spongiibacteraceae bacterium]